MLAAARRLSARAAWPATAAPVPTLCACALRVRPLHASARRRASGSGAVGGAVGGGGGGGTVVVSDVAGAERVLRVMRAQGAGGWHAVDTEVVDVDLEAQSPVGHGRVICASLYSGPSVDYGAGPGSRVWLDALAPGGGAALAALGAGLADPALRKVWHNYSFDRAVLANAGVAATLAADTMHMARLWDTARITRGGYSLEGLSADLLDRRKVPMKELFAKPRVKKVRRHARTRARAHARTRARTHARTHAPPTPPPRHPSLPPCRTATPAATACSRRWTSCSATRPCARPGSNTRPTTPRRRGSCAPCSRPSCAHCTGLAATASLIFTTSTLCPLPRA